MEGPAIAAVAVARKEAVVARRAVVEVPVTVLPHLDMVLLLLDTVPLPRDMALPLLAMALVATEAVARKEAVAERRAVVEAPAMVLPPLAMALLPLATVLPLQDMVLPHLDMVLVATEVVERKEAVEEAPVMELPHLAMVLLPPAMVLPHLVMALRLVVRREVAAERRVATTNPLTAPAVEVVSN